MKNLFVLLVIVVFTMICCTPPEKPLTSEEKSGIESEISGLIDTMIQELTNLDLDQFFSHYSNSDDFSLIMDAQIMIGGDTINSIKEQFQAYLKKYISFENAERHIFVLDRDIVLFIAPYSETAISQTDDTLNFKGTESSLFQKKDGTWKIINSTLTHLPPQ